MLGLCSLRITANDASVSLLGDLPQVEFAVLVVLGRKSLVLFHIVSNTTISVILCLCMQQSLGIWRSEISGAGVLTRDNFARCFLFFL